MLTDLHPNWLRLIEFCRQNPFLRLERVEIADGIPVQVETITQKLRLNGQTEPVDRYGRFVVES